uniref:BPTI/Kunitz inhibitor domain-containing protein n=1 Tax=Hippocampus comes TaxID=109280 RepID=A0A3Q2YLM4_HIPCM
MRRCGHGVSERVHLKSVPRLEMLVLCSSPSFTTPSPLLSSCPRCTAAPAEACLVPMEEGTCARFTLRWYFNSHVQACRPFIYSGCGGNDNRFVHLEECEEVVSLAANNPVMLTESFSTQEHRPFYRF